MSQYISHEWDDNWTAPVACYGQETVNALLTVLKNANTQSELLLQSVAFSGDVDTVAALALGIGRVSSAYEADLPAFLFTDLENGEFGKDHLSNMGDKLMLKVTS